MKNIQANLLDPNVIIDLTDESQPSAKKEELLTPDCSPSISDNEDGVPQSLNRKHRKRANRKPTTEENAGKFCWEEIDGTVVPYIISSSGELMAEIGMLKKALFKDILSKMKKGEEIFRLACPPGPTKFPLKYPASPAELSLLDEINNVHCDNSFSIQPYVSSSDTYLLKKEDVFQMKQVLATFNDIDSVEAEIAAKNFGYIKMESSDNIVPFVTIRDNSASTGLDFMVPLLFFFQYPAVSKIKCADIDYWSLVKLKILCRLLGIPKYFYDREGNELYPPVIMMSDVIKCIPETSSFKCLRSLPKSVDQKIRSKYCTEETKGNRISKDIVQERRAKVRKIAPKTEKAETKQHKGKKDSFAINIDIDSADDVQDRSFNNRVVDQPKNINDIQSQTTLMQATGIPQFIDASGQLFQSPTLTSNEIYQQTPLSGTTIINPHGTMLNPLAYTNTVQGNVLVNPVGMTIGTSGEQNMIPQGPANLQVSNSVVYIQQAPQLPQPFSLVSTTNPPMLDMNNLMQPSFQLAGPQPMMSLSGGMILQPTSNQMQVTTSQPVNPLPSNSVPIYKNQSPVVKDCYPSNNGSQESVLKVKIIPTHNSTRPLCYTVKKVKLKSGKHQFVAISKAPFDDSDMLINISEVAQHLFPQKDKQIVLHAVARLKLEIFVLNKTQVSTLNTFFREEKLPVSLNALNENLYFDLKRFRDVYRTMKMAAS